MSLIYKLRCKLSESFRIKNGFGLSPIRNERELKALIKFCKTMLKDYKQYGFESSNMKIWKKTVELYEWAIFEDTLNELKIYDKWAKLYKYIEDNSQSYWS